MNGPSDLSFDSSGLVSRSLRLLLLAVMILTAAFKAAYVPDIVSVSQFDGIDTGAAIYVNFFVSKGRDTKSADLAGYQFYAIDEKKGRVTDFAAGSDAVFSTKLRQCNGGFYCYNASTSEDELLAVPSKCEGRKLHTTWSYDSINFSVERMLDKRETDRQKRKYIIVARNAENRIVSIMVYSSRIGVESVSWFNKTESGTTITQYQLITEKGMLAHGCVADSKDTKTQ